MMVVMARTILIGLLAALALAPAALAAPPSLVTVAQTGGRATVTWTLPTAGQAWTMEIANAPAVDSDGYFVADNVVDTDVFIDSRTTWTSDEVLDPGTYYVHLSGWDKNCSTCPIPEWSTVKTLTVAASAGTPAGGSTAPTTTPTTTPTATAPTADPPASTTGTAPSSTSQPDAPAPTASVAPAVAGSGTVSAATAKLKGSVAQVAFRVCGSGNVEVKVLAQRGTRVLATVVTLPVASGGCLGYRLGVTVPKGTGAVTLSVAGTTVKL
jgi:hypothetical protein